MTQQESRSTEELISWMYDQLIKQRAAQLREEHPHLTKEQAIARSYSQYPSAYEAHLALQRARQQGK